VGSQDLIQGSCIIFKNRVFSTRGSGLLSYDEEKQDFKITGDGQIIIKFDVLQIKGYDHKVAGLFGKKQNVRVEVGFPDGNEFVLSFDSSDLNSYDRLVSAIKSGKDRREMGSELLRLAKSRERFSVEEVCSILSRHKMRSGFEDGKKMIEEMIVNGLAEGVFDGHGFVSKTALQRETVSYNIVAKFELDASGTLVIKCPSCGSSVPLESKETVGKCKYCGSTYTVPRKILDLV
jgi:DNA-directed RNA polymerase subunit RPC12/RpoP